MGRHSGDADGRRAGKRSHAVEHTRTDCHFGRLEAGLARPQRMACERFESMHQVLDQRATVVTAGPLPFAPATLCDGLDRPSGGAVDHQMQRLPRVQREQDNV